MGSRVAVAVLLTGVLLGGCGTSASEQSESARTARTLWSARTLYAGDNSRVAALVDTAGFGAEGTYTIALQTKESPYGVTLDFRRLDKPFEDTDFRSSATLLLGLVANLDHVSVTSDTHTYSVSATEISGRLGYDVKDLGRDQNTLQAYLDSIRD